MRIMLAVPTYETVSVETYKSIHELNIPDGTTVDFRPVLGYGVAHARNKLVDLALDGGYDRIFFVDNDVVLPKSSLGNLLSHNKNPLLLGYYPRRSKKGPWQGATSLYKPGERDYTQTYTADEIRELRESGQILIEVHGAGMGCALLDMDIFKRKVEYPWFKWTFRPGEARRTLSEDFYFLSKCRRAGIPILADTRVGCGHVIRYVQEVM